LNWIRWQMLRLAGYKGVAGKVRECRLLIVSRKRLLSREMARLARVPSPVPSHLMVEMPARRARMDWFMDFSWKRI